MKLRISDNLSLPLETVTQAIAILAKRRAGKSYTARRLSEQLLAAGQQIVIVDPKGDWWGIRSAADGKRPGYPVVIIGGEHADVKLEPGAGEIIAKLVVEERVSVLMDLSLLRKHEVATFMAIFLENLYRLKAQEKYRTPLMLMIDEADAIAPQKPQKGEERMLGAAEDIVRRGGQRGIGCTMVTQRSAVLNKNVLTQIQILIVLQTIAPQDLQAMDAWIEVHGSMEQRKVLMESLPALPVGTAWVWAPGWPEADGIFKRVAVSPIETFDSGATPKPGEKRIEPKTLADVDIEALKRQMASTIERTKAEDPRELRRQLAELQKKLAEKSPAALTLDPETLKREFERGTASVKREMGKSLREYQRRLSGVVTAAQTAFLEAGKALDAIGARFTDSYEKIAWPPPPFPELDTIIAESYKPEANNFPAAKENTIHPKAGVFRTHAAGGAPGLPEGERAILIAAAQCEGAERNQLSILTGYKRSTRAAYIQRLIGKGLAEIRQDGAILATEAGIAALGDFEPLPKGEDLQRYWIERLPSGESRILSLLLQKNGDGVPRAELATEFKRSTRDAYIQRLVARKLVVDGGRGTVRASEVLFQ